MQQRHDMFDRPLIDEFDQSSQRRRLDPLGEESLLDMFDRLIAGGNPADWQFWGKEPGEINNLTVPYTAEEMAGRYRDFIKEHPYEEPSNRPGDDRPEGGGGAAEGKPANQDPMPNA